MSVVDFGLCWSASRMFCRSFAEGVFIYFSLSCYDKRSSDCQRVGRFRRMINLFGFSLLCAIVAVLFSVCLNVADFYRLVLVALAASYFWFHQKNHSKAAVSNFNTVQNMKFVLTASILLALAVYSLNTISHMLLHISFVLIGIYDAVRSVDIFYQLYKTAIVCLDVSLIFLAYKFKFFGMKIIKSMSMHIWTPISFGLYLILSTYISYTYYIFYNIPLTDSFRDILLWILALMVLACWGFYLVIRNQAKLLSIKLNHATDVNILIWVINPSMYETTYMHIYDSDVFVSNFASTKITLKEKLDKLGINNEYRGYSELVFCLFLTRLFIGLKGWKLEREVFEQASLVIDTPVSQLRKNIADIIEYVWNTSEAETLLDGYYRPYCQVNTYDQTRHPGVEEFLMRIAGSI